MHCRVEIASCGGIEVLLLLLKSDNDTQKEEAARALWSLSTNENNKAKIAAYGGIDLLVALALEDTDEQSESALGTLWNLAYRNEERATSILSCRPEESFLKLISNGTQQQKSLAVGVLCFLGPGDEAKSQIAGYGGIPAFLQYTEGCTKDEDRVEGLEALQALCGSDNHSRRNNAVIDSLLAAKGIEILTKVAKTGNGKVETLANEILEQVRNHVHGEGS